MITQKKMKTLVVGCGLTDHWFDILLDLNNQDNGCLDIFYWVYSIPLGDRDKTIERQKEFPNTFFATAMDAIKAIPSKQVLNECLDEEMLRSFVEHEPIVMSMLDRMDPGNCFTYAERRRHYSRLLKYWIAVINEEDPELILFPQAPHMVYDYIIYMIAEQKGIEMLITNVNSALGRIMLAGKIEGIYERMFEAYNAHLKGKDKILDSDEEKLISTHISNLQKSYDQAKPHYMKMLEQRNEKLSVKSNNIFIKYAKSFYWKAKTFQKQIKEILQKPASPPENYLKKKGVPMEQAGYNSVEWIEQKKQERLFKSDLRELYESLSISKIDSTQKSVYIPLHYQPETTTCPEGGYFTDQQMMVEMFSVLLPDDWTIYVKEHYLQLQDNASKGHHCRDKQYYHDLAEMPKVRLVSLDVDSFELIDNCDIVATVLGYAAWESMVRGKPAFLFGRPWFSAFKNAYIIKSKQDFINAFDEVQNNPKKIQNNEIETYLRVYFAVSFAGFTSMWNRDVVKITEEQNIQNFVQNIRSYLLEKNNEKIT